MLLVCFHSACSSCRSLVATKAEDEEAVLTGQQARRPVAWLLLRPPRTHHRGPLQASAKFVAASCTLNTDLQAADKCTYGIQPIYMGTHQHMIPNQCAAEPQVSLATTLEKRWGTSV